MLLWLDSKTAREPFSSYDGKKLSVKLNPSYVATPLTKLTVLELNAKNIRDVTAGKEVLYLYCDIVQPSLLNGEQRQIVNSIVKPTGTVWGHKFFSSTEPIVTAVWPDEYDRVSIWIADTDNNAFACDYLTAVLRLEEH